MSAISTHKRQGKSTYYIVSKSRNNYTQHLWNYYLWILKFNNEALENSIIYNLLSVRGKFDHNIDFECDYFLRNTGHRFIKFAEREMVFLFLNHIARNLCIINHYNPTVHIHNRSHTKFINHETLKSKINQSKSNSNIQNGLHVYIKCL